jgi:hypothetical protein
MVRSCERESFKEIVRVRSKNTSVWLVSNKRLQLTTDKAQLIQLPHSHHSEERFHLLRDLYLRPCSVWHFLTLINGMRRHSHQNHELQRIDCCTPLQQNKCRFIHLISYHTRIICNHPLCTSKKHVVQFKRRSRYHGEVEL